MPCNPPKTNADKLWPYEEYYSGERDEENRKHGTGLHHWTGAESLECYEGRMVRDTMHGYGDYRWRYEGPNHAAVSYEGTFYNNSMHGYGCMSYTDGRTFTGLYYNNIRWGPGVESHACLREDVGLWYGYQLTRLAWRPPAPSVAIDLLSTPVGYNLVAPHRILLTTDTKIIGEVNTALELLKQYGAEPLAAAEKWPKLYPKHCTDTDSQLCHIEVFDRAYFHNKIQTLTEGTAESVKEKFDSQASGDSMSDKKTYYAWNNDQMITHMMKHSFTHEEQRKKVRVNLPAVLVGSRSAFKTAGKHELDCRTLMMAAYLGHISKVAQLINENDVISDVTDMQGNSVVMYAACGDQPEILHFLVEAGGLVDGYNDACCTPLGITLLRYALETHDIAYSGMLQAVLPPSDPGPPLPDDKIFEWYIRRNLTTPTNGASNVQMSPSKLTNKTAAHTPVKRAGSKDTLNNKKKTESPKTPDLPKIPEVDPFAEEKTIYNNIKSEYLTKVAELFACPSGVNPIPYLFEVRCMVKEIEMNEEDPKNIKDKNTKKTVSKVLKDAMKPSRDLMWQGMDKEDGTLDIRQQMKQEKLSRIMQTIMQLLSEGADPRKVRCPQPPLFIASVSGCADLVRELVKHSANIDEVYPEAFGYTTLDLAVSGPMTPGNLEVIRTLLECGAKADHRLLVVPEPVVASSTTGGTELYKEEGPTLLHAIMARKLELETEEELRRQIVQLLLQYGCNPSTQFKGHSAVEIAMNKSADLFDIIIKGPKTDLNAIINDLNQSILVKMFYLPYCRTITLTERLQTLTNLLLYGADPLIKCQNGNDVYENLFVYARKTLSELEQTRKIVSPTGNPKKSKSEIKSKKSDKPKKEENVPGKPNGKHAAQGTKIAGKTGDDQIGDFKQALDLVVDCARLLYIRWLQAKLMKDLINVVNKYKHRTWNMIEKENKKKKCTGLWLTAVRCLEIWDALKTTKKKIYNDEKNLKHVLCIIHFYYKRTRKILRCPDLTFQEKTLIEVEVASYIHEHKLAISTPDMLPAIRPYVTPELTVKEIKKFNVCFECCMPLTDEKIPCCSCKLIAFCSFECMKQNIDRINCHPCSSFLKDKYFPTPEETETDADLV